MEKYIEALQGITHSDWTKLKIGIDRTFDMKKSEFERELKLADAEMTKKIIRSQFG